MTSFSTVVPAKLGPDNILGTDLMESSRAPCTLAERGHLWLMGHKDTDKMF